VAIENINSNTELMLGGEEVRLRIERDKWCKREKMRQRNEFFGLRRQQEIFQHVHVGSKLVGRELVVGMTLRRNFRLRRMVI
jgi:hypothetical protein